MTHRVLIIANALEKDVPMEQVKKEVAKYIADLLKKKSQDHKKKGGVMPTDLSNMNINRIILHEIFARNENRDIVSPTYSEFLTQLSPEGLQSLQKRIVSAIGAESRSIEMIVENDQQGSTFEICTRLLEIVDDNDFIKESKQIPRKLSESQASRKIPGGAVIIIDGTIGGDSKRFIAIIKADIHDGFDKQQTGHSLALRYITDLVLTPQQKLYKIGLFVEKVRGGNRVTSPTQADYTVYVYDHNLTKDGTSQFAQYFYEGFLGCSFMKNGKKLTSDFYYTTKSFINKLDIDEESKLDIITGLHSYLNVVQTNVVEGNRFATDYLAVGHRDAYLRTLETAGIPSHPFERDITFIKDKLKRRRLTFTSAVKLFVPSDNFDELVQIIGHENDRTSVSIKGQVVNES